MEATDPPDKVWYTTQEAAVALGYKTRDSVLALIRTGHLKAHRLGAGKGRYRIPRSELERLAAAPETAA